MKKYLTIFIILGLLLALAPVTSVKAHNTQIRPIEEFVAAQGRFCIDDGNGGCVVFVPPLPNFMGFTDTSAVRAASVDYAGLGAEWLKVQTGISLGTKIEGSVIERPLKDGRAEVEVLLKTQNALTWVVDGYDFASGTLLFGSRAPDVANGATPGLCDSFLQVKFINMAPGAPLPDLIQLAFFPEPSQALEFMALRCNATGPLQAAFGVPNNTPGRATIVQTGIFMSGFHGAVTDGFPVERIDLRPAGKVSQ